MLYILDCNLLIDFRMTVGEDKDKVRKIVDGSLVELKQLYKVQLSKMSEFLYIPFDTNSDNLDIMFEQDMSPGARHFHLTMLPKSMQETLVRVSLFFQKCTY